MSIFPLTKVGGVPPFAANTAVRQLLELRDFPHDNIAEINIIITSKTDLKRRNTNRRANVGCAE